MVGSTQSVYQMLDLFYMVLIQAVIQYIDYTLQ